MPFVKIRLTNPKFILSNTEKQIVACESNAKEVSFKLSHNKISSTKSKVSIT